MFYLDNAATTWPKPETIYQTLDSSFRKMFSPKRGTATASRLGSNQLLEARQVFANFFKLPNPERLVFTNGCTHALNIAIQGFQWNPGDAVIMSAIEHHALSRPIRKMAQEKGIRFLIVPYSDAVPFDLTVYENYLKKESNIRLVATTHSSNVIGSILPIEEIGKLAHQYGAHYLVDAAQTAGVIPINVQSMNIDLMALPGHKSLYGPPGIGALYMGEGVQLHTFMEGGTGNDSGRHEMHADPPDGFEVGTIPMPLILAFAAGVQWVEETGISHIHQHEIVLLDQLLKGLHELPELTVYGHQDLQTKTPVVSFNLPGINPKALGEQLFQEYGIALRAGFHCAPMAHEALGTISLGGTVRASLGYFTQPEDVKALIHALKTIIQQKAAPILPMGT